MRVKVLVGLVIITLVFVSAFFITYKREVGFNIYTKVEILENPHNFGEIIIKDTVFYDFKIKNVGENPFLITDVISSKNIFVDFKLQLYQKDEVAIVSVKYISKKQGKVREVIRLESNVNQENGSYLDLILEGFVRK